MRICIFAFGKLKTPGLRETADYYKKLIRPWVKLDEVEIKPLAVPDKSTSTRLIVQEKESKLLLDRMKSETSKSQRNPLLLLLDETGKSKTTAQWAKDFQDWESEGIPTLSFCIGSSLGFSGELKARAHGAISLGPQTLPHELARVVLMEQIFRAYSVLKGHPYHNEGG